MQNRAITGSESTCGVLTTRVSGGQRGHSGPEMHFSSGGQTLARHKEANKNKPNSDSSSKLQGEGSQGTACRRRSKNSPRGKS